MPDEDEVVVNGWAETADGDVRGDLTWAGAPGMTLNLLLTRDGRVTELRAQAPEGGSLGSRDLRKLPIGAMTAKLRSRIAEDLKLMRGFNRHGEIGHFKDGRLVIRPATGDEERKSRKRWTEAIEWASGFTERPGRAGRNEADLARLAAHYVALLDEGERRPVKRLAEVLHLADATVRNQLLRARERGLLTGAGKGRAGGQLTDRAKELLDGTD